MDESKPLPPAPSAPVLCTLLAESCGGLAAEKQGLTLVHFSAQLKRILSDRGAFRDCLGGVWEVSGGIKEYQGVFWVYFVSETAQIKLRSGRV